MTIRKALVLVAAGLFALNAQADYYGGELCAYKSYFKCVAVKRGQTWVSLFPDERQRQIVQRLNRTNMRLRARPWIVVPLNLDKIAYKDLSPFADREPLKSKQPFLVVSLKQQAFGAFTAQGKLIHWGPISGGKGFCTDTMEYCRTVVGQFKITRKQGIGCTSSRFPLETEGGAPMPYCMHFFRGFAMHGAKLPGRHASHGCVRLFTADARWLNEHFGKIGTPVIVKPY